MFKRTTLVLFTALLVAAITAQAQEKDEPGKLAPANGTSDAAPPAEPPVEPINSIGEAINKAGRQRMLTQRIVKCYAQMGQDIRYLVASSQLSDSLELFERQLQQLKGFTQDAKSQRLLVVLEGRWQPMKQIAAGDVSRDQAEILRTLAEHVLAAAHQLVLLLEERSGSSQGHLVNLAGRQRMLSQRMANLYLLMNWGLNNPRYLADYDQAVQEFDNALYELNTAAENTPQISAALQRTGSMWEMFKLGSRADQGEYVPTLATRLLDKIMLQMNLITGMYAALQTE